MKRKGIFTILAAVFMVLAFSAMAFAANQVFLKTTVPNIPKSTCYQAGTDTMEFDNLSNMAEGDVMEFTLNNKVTVCKAINMFVTFGTQPGNALDTTGDMPVSTTGGTITAAGAGNMWGFLVQAPVGSQIIRLTLRQRITATGVLAALNTANVVTYTATTPSDKFVVKLFDSKVGDQVTPASSIWKQATPAVANTYFTAAVADDNVLCIDTLTQDYLGEYVQNTPNSIPGNVAQKLNFSGDYVIAHILSAQTFNLVTCKGTVCGHIELGSTTQTGGTCNTFDYETNATSGYCSDHKATTGFLPKFIIQTNQAFQNNVNYTVTAEILVNGVAGEHGVYWTATAPAYKTSDTSTCGSTVGAVAFAGQTYYRGDGTTTVATPHAAGSNTCAAVLAAEKAVKFVTTAGALFAADQFFFELNLPPFIYNLAEVNSGDVVTVRVTLTKGTCGSVSFDLCIGTFGCVVTPPSAATGSCILPFVPSLAAGDTYWSGLAISNNSSAAGTVKLTAYKKDGTTAEATVSVPSKGLVSDFVYGPSFTWTGTRPVGVPAYIQLDSTGFSTTNLNAFVFMADSISTGDSDSMGYTCVK